MICSALLVIAGVITGGLAVERVSYPSGKPNIVTELFELQTGDQVSRAILTHNLLYSILRPVVLIVPDWTGKPNLEIHQAINWAEKGFVGCAVDIYRRWDSGPNATLDDLTLPLPTPLPAFPHANRTKFVEVLAAILNNARGFDNTYIDRNKAAAIGFGIGGTMVLDLARSGAVLDGVVSFKANLSPPPGGITKPPITAKILVHSQYDDEDVPVTQVEDFEREMTGLSADWQVVTYGKPSPYGSSRGREGSDKENLLNKRSLTTTKDFFAEIFGEETLSSEPLGNPRKVKGGKNDRQDPVFIQANTN